LGNKLKRHGRQNPPGGRPTKEEAEIKKALIEKYWAEIDKRLDVFQRQGCDARSDVVNRAVPYAKQELEHSGEIGVRPWIVDAYQPK